MIKAHGGQRTKHATSAPLFQDQFGGYYYALTLGAVIFLPIFYTSDPNVSAFFCKGTLRAKFGLAIRNSFLRI